MAISSSMIRLDRNNRVPVSRKWKVTAHFRIGIEQVDKLFQQNQNVAGIMNNLTDGKKDSLTFFSYFLNGWTHGARIMTLCSHFCSY
jgi:hypothetical protein